MSEKLKTTVAFDHSPDAKDGGKYLAKQIVQLPDGKQQELPTLEIPASANQFVVEGVEGMPILLLICYVSPDGVYSPATPIQFEVSKKAPPGRPTNPRVSKVVPVLEVMPNDNRTLVMVEGHPDIVDGAVGVMADFAAVPHSTHAHVGIEAVFEESSLRPGVKVGGPLKYELLVDDPKVVTSIVRPDQTIIPLRRFLEEQEAKAA